MEYSTSLTLDFLANNLKQPVCIYDIEAKELVFANLAFEKGFNLSTGSRVDLASLLERVHPEDRSFLIETFRKHLEGKGGDNLEFRVLEPGQEIRWLCLEPSLAVGTEGERLFVCSITDITPSRKYNDYLKKYGSKKNSVLHVLAHDLAGPLGVINSLTVALAEEAKPLANAEFDKLVDLIGKTSENCVSLIKDLTNHEFLETTGVDLIKRRVNIVEKFGEVIEQYRNAEFEINKTFRFYMSSPHIYAPLDDTKFMQAINNLISNAIKFTPEGGIITVSLEEKENTVLVKVADNGVGIPEKYHKNLFDKFTRARRPGLKGEPTTGLGMSIIKTIVEWHQGEIWFESEQNVGTTFFIEIPKAE